MLSVHPLQELGSFWKRMIMPAGLLVLACAKSLEAGAPGPRAPPLMSMTLPLRRSIRPPLPDKHCYGDVLCRPRGDNRSTSFGLARPHAEYPRGRWHTDIALFARLELFLFIWLHNAWGASCVSPLETETNFSWNSKSGFTGTTVLRVDGMTALQQLDILKTA